MHCLGGGQGGALLEEGDSWKEAIIILQVQHFLSILVPFSSIGKDSEVLLVVGGIRFLLGKVTLEGKDSFPPVCLVGQESLRTEKVFWKTFVDKNLLLDRFNFSGRQQHFELGCASELDINATSNSSNFDGLR